ncbi:hypothetical protein BAP_2029 [Bacillus sp. CN2]|nr:hypothetical protein BAP_2029 [Bacillus sp. CN2]
MYSHKIAQMNRPWVGLFGTPVCLVMLNNCHSCLFSFYILSHMNQHPFYKKA